MRPQPLEGEEQLAGIDIVEVGRAVVEGGDDLETVGEETDARGPPQGHVLVVLHLAAHVRSKDEMIELG